MKGWPSSVKELRVSAEVVEANERARQAKRRRRSGKLRDGAFLAGPVPMAWLKRAKDLGVRPLWLGLALWHLRGLSRSNSFIVSNVKMSEMGISRSSKSRALAELERARLIKVEHRGRRSPRVTLVMLELVEGGSDAD
jgi:hypothetical protein